MIGINNRNLGDLSVDLETTSELIVDVPGRQDRGLGVRATTRASSSTSSSGSAVDAVLIGEALMRSGDPEAAVRELTMDEERTREHYIDRARTPAADS